VFDPSGTAILVTARPDLGPDGLDVATPLTSCRVSVGGGELQPVLDPARYPRCGSTPATVLDGGAALVAVERPGAVELLRVPLDGGPPAALVDGPFTVRGFAAAAGVVVATVAHDRSAGELVAVTPGRRRLLTGFGSALGATGRLHRTEERRVVVPGGTEVPVWVTVPPGEGPHAVVLLASGGRPGWSLRVEVQVYVSAGYAVVHPHPRAAARADVLAVLDAALADPALDAGRVALAGGPRSAALLARTDRFAAAVIAWDEAARDEAARDEAVGDAWPAGAGQGDVTAVDVTAVVTPTLLVQAERCPLGGGRRLFAALQGRGVPSALLLVPGDGTGTDRLRHRPARLEHLLEWWDRWLPAGALPEEDEGWSPAPEGTGAP
jgi:dipeptidyl aminopeptidase/acylaminoacyl peptidase